MHSKHFEELDKEKAYDVLKKICLEIPFENTWINSGTLLGIYRDNDFITHDTDIDIGVISSLNKEMVRLYYPILSQWKFDERIMQTVYLVDDVHVDLWYWWDDLEEGKLINITTNGVWRMDKSIISPTKEYQWNLINMPVPNNVEGSLLFQYADWETPRTYKNSWFINANSLESFEVIKEFYEK